MSDLIAIGRSGVMAYQSALAAVGENVTNADTDGFARRKAVMKEQVAAPSSQYLSVNRSDFNGVSQTNVTRAFDQYRASTAWTANSDASYASTRSQYLSTVQGELNDNDTGIGTKLTAIFTAGAALAANPSDGTLRQSMLYAIGDATGALGQSAAMLDKVGVTIGQQATAQVAGVNTALQQLAKLNLSLQTSPQGSSGRAALEDQRDTLINTISSAIGVDVTLDQTGAATLKLSNYAGPTLISSGNALPSLVTVAQSAKGRLSMTLVDSNGKTSAATPTSGSLAGYMDAANNVSDNKDQLDGIAVALRDQLNDWNKGGKLADGITQGDKLLDGTGAEDMAFLTGVGPDSIAASDGTASNGNLLIPFGKLRQPTGVETMWHGAVTDQALKVSAATTASTTAAAQKDSAYSALDETSGVNLDSEAADLLRFQQAYSASSKIIQAAKDTFQTILGLF